jgi:hypothetical protein
MTEGMSTMVFAPRGGGTLRRAAMSTLTLAAIFLGTSFMICPLPLLGHFPALNGPLAAEPLTQILPTVAAMLGVLAGVLGMTAAASAAEAPSASANGAMHGRMPEPPSTDPAGNGGAGNGAAGLQAAIADLRALLAEERRELGTLRELSSNGTKETMLLAERLASTALDAELRLTASVVQAERALRYPSSAATRAAETSVKVERMLSRTETVLRTLPEATTQAISTLQQETAALLNAAHQLPPGADMAPSRLPTGWQQELAALRAAGQEITISAQEAVATLSHAAQSTIGRLTEAVVSAVEATHASHAEPAGESGTRYLPDRAFSDQSLSERTLADLAGLTIALQTVADTITDRTEALCATGQHVETTAARLAERLPAAPTEWAGPNPGDAAFVERLEQAVAYLHHETGGLSAAVARVAALEPMIDQHLSAAALVTEAASRAEQSAASVATASQVIVETTDEVVLQIARLAGISGHAETQAAVLPAIAAQMAEATGRLQAATLHAPQDPALRALPETLARLEATLPKLDGLERVSARLEHALDGLAAPEGEAALLTRLDGLSAGIAAAIGRVETALAQQGGTAEALLSGLTQVQAGLADVSARLAPEGTPPTAAASGDPSTLHQIDVVARETALLLRQTEALAEAVVAGRAPGLPPLLAECTPALLAGVDATIARLRSVATALALASDGPPAKQRAALYASGNPDRS